MNKNNKWICFWVLVISILFLYCGNKIATSHSENILVQNRESELEDQVFAQVLKIDSVSPKQDDKTINIVKFTAKITNGKAKDLIVHATQYSYLNNATMPKVVSEKDNVVLSKLSSDNTTEWAFENYERIDQIIILCIIFIVLILLFGGKKGVSAILSLAFTCLSIFYVFVPFIMAGYNIYLSTIIICIFIIEVTFVLTSGINKKSLAAAIGCAGGVVFSGCIYCIMDETMKLTGFYNDESTRLTELFVNQPLNLRAIVFAMVTIGALGATMDVAMSISSSLDEISNSGNKVSRSSIIKSGLNIGKDIMGTMANTLILAYIGSSLVTVVIYSASNYPLLQLLNKEEIIIEFLQSLVGSLGMLLTIPFTTVISAILLTNIPKRHY
jgi:uncharacterized membrane protein